MKENYEKLSELFSALVSKQRMQILNELVEGGGSASHAELKEVFEGKMSVWYHINILRKVGILTRRQPGHTKECVYEVDVDALEEARRKIDSWINGTLKSISGRA